jgi:DNA (cytosine-5)-methyltransferase 1
MKQMELPLSVGDSHANPSVKLEKEKAKMTTDISGMKLLELLPKQNQNGLLEKMLTDLLASKTAWYSDKCKMTWRKRVSKSNVLLFQLQASVLGTKEKESGSSDTMYPTPSASCQMDVVAPPNTVNQNKSGWSVTRLKTGTKFGAKLNDVVNKLDHEGMYPTPMARDYKDMGFKPTWKWRRDKSVPSVALKDNTHGGKLNPNFVEFLMGYPTNWTKIEPIE